MHCSWRINCHYHAKEGGTTAQQPLLTVVCTG
jgi:hypothetical protein